MEEYQGIEDNILPKPNKGTYSKIPDRIPLGYDLWIVLLLSTGALVPAWFSYDIISRDGAHLYIPVARLFLEGKHLEAIFGPLKPLLLPLYEFLIFFLSRISGIGLETSGRLISSASFVIGALGLYKICNLLFKDRVISFISILFFISNRDLLSRSVDCLKESLLVCLILWANYLVLKGLSSPARWRYFSAGFLFFLLGGMVRSVSFIFLASWLIVWVFHKKRGILERSVRIILPAGVLLLPVYLYPHPWIDHIFRRSYDFSSLIPVDLGLSERLIAASHFIRQLLARSYYLIALFALVGAYRKRHDFYPVHALVTLFIFFAISVVIGWDQAEHGADRYLLVFIVWFYPIAAFAVSRSLGSRNKVLKALAILLLVISPLLWAGKAFTPPDPDKLARKDAGEWILAHSGPGKVILTSRERIAFYAQGYWLDLDLYKKHKILRMIKNKSQDRLVLPQGKKSEHDGLIVVIDTKLESGRFLYGVVNSLGIFPEKVFRTLYVYFL